jgi:predicted Zn-dependent protease
MPFGYGNDGRGFSPRILIGVAIAIFGLVGYFMKTQTNPVTGEAQRVNLNVNQEIALGLQAAPRMIAEMGGEVPPSDPDARLVRETGRRLVQYTEAGRSPYRFDFHLLRDDRTINAFALPGGQIFITRGLYDKLENQAQLAGVLGHEIGHVIERHTAQQMAKQGLGQALVTAVTVGASDDYRKAAAAQAVGSMLNQVTQLGYSREHESEADSKGLQYMTQAGFTPEGMLGVMKVLQDASRGNRQPEFLATHPDPGNRYAKIKEFIAKNYPQGIPSSLTNGVRLR